MTIVVDIAFVDGNKTTRVSFDSDDGCVISVQGTLFPMDLATVNEIVSIVRAKKDRYNVASKTPSKFRPN